MSALDDDEITPEELQEASELARVLDGGGLDAEPGDALQAAALLRVSRKPQLDERRQQQLLDELVENYKPKQEVSISWLRWLWLVTPAAVGGLALWVAMAEPDEPVASVARHSAELESAERLEDERSAGGAEKPGAPAAAAAADEGAAPSKAKQRRGLAELPRPSRKLLRMQAQVLQGQLDADYEMELSAYRGEVLAVLEARYRR